MCVSKDFRLKQIELTKGFFATVDDSDYLELCTFNWCTKIDRSLIYAHRGIKLPSGKWTTQTMHRFITKALKGEIVDHINHDCLDNRKSNLRITSCSVNSFNRKGANTNSSTGFRGVTHIKRLDKYRVRIRKISLGLYDTLEIAVKLANKYIKEN